MKKILLSASFITLIVMGINFVFKVFLSYKLSKDEIGVFYTFMDFVSIGIMLFSGYKDSLIRAFDKEEFEIILFWYSISFWILFGIVLFIEIIYFKILEFKYPLYILIAVLFSNSLMIFFSYLNAAYKKYKIMLFENLVQSISLIIFYFIFSSFIKKIDALIYAYIFSFLSKILFILFFSNMKLKIKASSIKKVKEFFKNTIFSTLMYFLSGFFISMSSIILYKLYNDPLILSEYQLVVKSIFFALVAIFVYPLNTFTFPYISKAIAKNEFKKIKEIEKKFLKYLILFFLIIVFSLPFSKYPITLIFSKEYENSYILLNILLPMLPFIAYTTLAINIIKAFDRFDLAFYIRALGSLVFFISSFLFYMFNFDAKSVIYSLDISFLTMFFAAFFIKKKIL